MEIKGFTPLQQAIADLVWSMETAEDIIDWYNACDDEIKPIAHSVITMLKYEYIDSTIEKGVDLTVANNVINYIKEM